MSLKSYLLDLIFPLNCLNCKQEGQWLCEKCFRRLRFNEKEYRLAAPDMEKIFLAGNYDDRLLAELIKKLKFDSIIKIGPILGRFLVLFWQGIIFCSPELAADILIIPIPLSNRRRRFRGFNQAEILADYFSGHFGYELNLDLKRRRHRRPQSSLSEAERTENIKDVFAWSGEDLAGRTILLIDDVATTGATLNEAARVLKEAGADKVYGLVAAKG